MAISTRMNIHDWANCFARCFWSSSYHTILKKRARELEKVMGRIMSFWMCIWAELSIFCNNIDPWIRLMKILYFWSQDPSYYALSPKVFLERCLKHCFRHKFKIIFFLKVQFILRCPFRVFKSSKNQWKFFRDFCPSLYKEVK